MVNIGTLVKITRKVQREFHLFFRLTRHIAFAYYNITPNLWSVCLLDCTRPKLPSDLKDF